MNQYISPFAFRLFIGVVLTSAMIIALFNLTRDLHAYLGRFEDGDLLQLGVFFILLVLSALALFFLLMSNKTKAKTENINLSMASILSFDFRVLGIKFIEGFIDGLTKENDQINNQK